MCNTFLTNFRKRYKVEYIWFLEFTKKNRPHLHVICQVDPNQFDRLWLGHIWAKITVYNYAKRLNAGKYEQDAKLLKPFDEWVIDDEMKKVFNVHSHPKCWEKIRKEDGATRYCLKYATKEEQKLVPPSFHNVGRFWGTSYGLKPKPLGELIIGETMTEEAVKAILNDTRIGQYPLIPKYVFEQDALQYFQSRGMKLTEIFDENGKHKKHQNGENMVD